MWVTGVSGATISWCITLTTGTTSSFCRAGTTSSTAVFMFILSKYGYEHSIKLIICGNHTLKDHISKLYCFFLDAESRILRDTKFEIVRWILLYFDANQITECIAIEWCTYRCFKIGELLSWSDKDNFHSFLVEVELSIVSNFEKFQLFLWFIAYLPIELTHAIEWATNNKERIRWT